MCQSAQVIGTRQRPQMGAKMRIETKRDDEAIQLTIIGRVDANTSEDLQQEILLSFQKTKKVILDFGQVDYISSAGLRALLIGQKTAESKHAEMVLRKVSDIVLNVLTMTGFNEILTIEE